MANRPYNPNDYEAFVALRFKTFPTTTESLLHGVIGVAGEAGELLDAVKKTWAYGKPLDLANVIEELGDIEFYLQAIRLELKLTRFGVIEHNMAKLDKRYPRGYSDQAAIARADKDPS